jgi:hypothetical protein
MVSSITMSQAMSIADYRGVLSSWLSSARKFSNFLCSRDVHWLMSLVFCTLLLLQLMPPKVIDAPKGMIALRGKKPIMMDVMDSLMAAQLNTPAVVSIKSRLMVGESRLMDSCFMVIMKLGGLGGAEGGSVFALYMDSRWTVEKVQSDYQRSGV